jgi:hypothetical protein
MPAETFSERISPAVAIAPITVTYSQLLISSSYTSGAQKEGREGLNKRRKGDSREQHCLLQLQSDAA